MSICLNQVNHIGSNKFGFISSSNLVQTLESKGLKLADVVESKIRKDKEKRLGYQKHVMRFNTGISNAHGNLQLLAINSHEGSSALTFRLGFFRLVCSNGLIVGSDLIPQIKVRHTSNGLLKLDNAIDKAMEYQTAAKLSMERMMDTKVNSETFETLGKNILKIRLGDKYSDKIVPLFESKRWEDNKEDLFSVFNVIQENVIRTGFYALNKETNVTTKIRAIRGVESNVVMNNALFNEAIKFVA
jgi:hypothetical protein